MGCRSVSVNKNTACHIVHDQINSVEPKKFCGELVVQQGNIDARSDHGNAYEVLALQKQKCRSNDCNADQSDTDKISLFDFVKPIIAYGSCLKYKKL